MRHATIIALILCTSVISGAGQLEIIQLMHLNAKEFATSLRGGTSERSETLSREAADFATDVMADVANRGQGRTSMPEALGYSRARAVPEAGGRDLSSLMPEGLTTLAAAPNQNALIVRGEREAIDELREVVKMLDVPTPMVNVDLMMDRISRQSAREIDPHLRAWGWAGDVSAGALPEPVLGFRAGSIRGLPGYEAGTTRRHTVTGANVTGFSGTPLVISAGEARPQYQSEVWYDPWGQRHVRYHTSAAFAGITLRVLPTVNADQTVTMVLRPVLSEVVGRAGQVGPNDIIRRTMVETKVRVPDGQSLVIGGLDRRLDEMTRNFPASRGWQRGSDSSVITVTPAIIRTDQR